MPSHRRRPRWLPSRIVLRPLPRVGSVGSLWLEASLADGRTAELSFGWMHRDDVVHGPSELDRLFTYDGEGRTDGVEVEFSSGSDWPMFVREWKLGQMHGACACFDQAGQPVIVTRYEEGVGEEFFAGRMDGEVTYGEYDRYDADGSRYSVMWWGEDDEVSHELVFNSNGNGIFRQWTDGELDVGRTSYQLGQEMVSKETYAQAAASDADLPPLDPALDRPTRARPVSAQEAMERARVWAANGMTASLWLALRLPKLVHPS